VLVPANPGNVSAFGLLTVDVKNDYVRTAVARHAELDVDRAEVIFAELQERAAAALDREGFARAEHRYLRSADLRYFGQAFEGRAPGYPTGRSTRRPPTMWPQRSMTRTGRSTVTTSEATRISRSSG